MRIIKLHKRNLVISDEVDILFEKKVTKFGTGAKIDCPKEHIGKTVYVLIRRS